MPPRAARCPTRSSSGGACEGLSGGGATRGSGRGGGGERGRRGRASGGIAAVEGIQGGGEKEVAPAGVGMTYLRNQVYVGRRSIVLARLPRRSAAVTAAVLSTVFVVRARCRRIHGDARVYPARTGFDPNRYAPRTPATRDSPYRRNLACRTTECFNLRSDEITAFQRINS